MNGKHESFFNMKPLLAKYILEKKNLTNSDE